MMPGADRILDFATQPARLSTRHNQLVVQRDEQTDVTIPLREIAVLVLTESRIRITQPVLASLMEEGGSLLVCNDRHQPAGLMLPLAGNTTQTERMLAQVKATLPTCKRLWKQIIQEKIRSQAATLDAVGGDGTTLRHLVIRVRSGDPQNVEAQAAARYWPLLFSSTTFRRRREADDQNRLLNYGYAILRAAVGRAICASGLHPSLGVHHHGRNNPWCLADDLMEPYRPLVDAAVCEIVSQSGSDTPLDANSKRSLIAVLTERLDSEGEHRTVLEWIGHTAASLARVYLGEADRISFPKGLGHAPNRA